MLSGKRGWKTKVFVFYGSTGSGKTRAVFDQFPNAWFAPDAGCKWFDGYCGDANVLIDDFDGHSVPITYMLKLTDRYPMQVPVKGGFTQWVPRRLFLTSNVPFEEWYRDACEEHREALRRRIDVLLEFPTDTGLINWDYE